MLGQGLADEVSLRIDKELAKNTVRMVLMNSRLREVMRVPVVTKST